MASSSTGKSTDGADPIPAHHDEFDKLLNTVEELILSDGSDDFANDADVLCEVIESLNEILELNFSAIASATMHWDSSLRAQPRAFQQMIYLLKLAGVEKNLWKRLMPSLSFARLSDKALDGAERWKPPRRRKKRKHTRKKKKLAGISYMVSIKKMLRTAIEEKDLQATEQIMKEMEANMPFGSSAHLADGVQDFRRHNETEMGLRKRQKKMRHCYFVKLGKGAMPKLADEHFCTRNRRFIMPYRDPKKHGTMTLQDELKRQTEGSDSDSDDE